MFVEWNKSDQNLHNSKSYSIFKNYLLEIGRPVPQSTNNILHPLGLWLLIYLRFGVSHLNQHKFNHKLKDCINPLCLYS